MRVWYPVRSSASVASPLPPAFPIACVETTNDMRRSRKRRKREKAAWHLHPHHHHLPPSSAAPGRRHSAVALAVEAPTLVHGSAPPAYAILSGWEEGRRRWATEAAASRKACRARRAVGQEKRARTHAANGRRRRRRKSRSRSRRRSNPLDGRVHMAYAARVCAVLPHAVKGPPRGLLGSHPHVPIDRSPSPHPFWR